MSILAEPRRKQRISIDPQNLNWKNDDQKFSKKLMEKMGWSEGDGLGRNRQGDANNVKLKPNYSGKGLGADKLNDYDSTWISHHDDFADLLAALNKNKEQEPEQTEEEKAAAAEKISIELKSKSVRRRIHYQKFTRAKDTSNYSENDKKGILGLGRLKGEKKEEEKEEKIVKEEEEEQKTEEPSAGNTHVSSMSVGDYFAAKMAAIKAKRVAAKIAEDVIKKEEPEEEMVKQEVKEEPEEEEEEDEEERARRKAEKKERKRLRREQRERERIEAENLEVKQEVVEEQEEIDEEERKRLKKEKKRLKRMLREQNEEETGENKKKKKSE